MANDTQRYRPVQLGGTTDGDIRRHAYWPSNKRQHPLLFIVAHQILLAPGHSMSCERLNSAAVRVFTVLRNRLGNKSLENLLLALRLLRKRLLDATDEQIADIVEHATEDELDNLIPENELDVDKDDIDD